MDPKIVDSHKSRSDLIVNLTDEIDALNKGKLVGGRYSLETMKPSSSATLVSP